MRSNSISNRQGEQHYPKMRRVAREKKKDNKPKESCYISQRSHNKNSDVLKIRLHEIVDLRLIEMKAIQQNNFMTIEKTSLIK